MFTFQGFKMSDSRFLGRYNFFLELLASYATIFSSEILNLEVQVYL